MTQINEINNRIKEVKKIISEINLVIKNYKFDLKNHITQDEEIKEINLIINQREKEKYKISGELIFLENKKQELIVKEEKNKTIKTYKELNMEIGEIKSKLRYATGDNKKELTEQLNELLEEFKKL